MKESKLDSIEKRYKSDDDYWFEGETKNNISIISLLLGSKNLRAIWQQK